MEGSLSLGGLELGVLIFLKMQENPLLHIYWESSYALLESVSYSGSLTGRTQDLQAGEVCPLSTAPVRQARVEEEEGVLLPQGEGLWQSQILDLYADS